MKRRLKKWAWRADSSIKGKALYETAACSVCGKTHLYNIRRKLRCPSRKKST